jgi:hypothetical protein
MKQTLVATILFKKIHYKLVIILESEGKGPLGRLDESGRIILKLTLRERGWSGMAWIDVAQD